MSAPRQGVRPRRAARPWGKAHAAVADRIEAALRARGVAVSAVYGGDAGAWTVEVPPAQLREAEDAMSGVFWDPWDFRVRRPAGQRDACLDFRGHEKLGGVDARKRPAGGRARRPKPDLADEINKLTR